MTFSTPQNFFYAGGTWDLSWIEWIWDNIAWDVRVKKNLPGPRTYDDALAAWKSEGPKMLETLPLLDVEATQRKRTVRHAGHRPFVIALSDLLQARRDLRAGRAVFRRTPRHKGVILG